MLQTILQNTQNRRSGAGAAPAAGNLTSGSAHHQSGGGGATRGGGDSDIGRHLPQLKVAQEKIPAPVGKQKGCTIIDC